ncbi:MAG: hypothetical protein EZS28_008836 [Streblomastix strix]|uniref:Uncharacterized protein n=1 Tax=Streblomastix strix TaxID=222440 RepID=A0A5J4WN32_9EUKA|nr:MAG: hypothetical protein EZS28_008836 [Streblomastix strix]
MHFMRHLVLDMFHLIDLNQSSENDLINFDSEAIRFDLVVTLHLIHVYCIMTLGHYYNSALIETNSYCSTVKVLDLGLTKCIMVDSCRIKEQVLLVSKM